MTAIEDPFFELNLVDAGGAQIPPQRFRTPQDAMTVAEDYEGASGAILYYLSPGADPVEVIVYRDGSIAVGAGVPDDDEDYQDEPWTEEEIAENFRRGRELGAERESEGL